MNTKLDSIRRALNACLLALLCSVIAVPSIGFAKQGATDPIPGTSNGATNSGGGGGNSKSKSKTTTPTTPSAPAPAPQPIVTGTLTFTAAASVNNVIPVCTGSYRVDPYYPTLSLMTLSVNTSSVNVPDGTPLYITINVGGGTGYPFTSNVVLIAGQAGSCTMNEYITPGTTITSVTISDASGAIVFAGN